MQREILAVEVAVLRADGQPVTIIDVREPNEYVSGHIDGAKLLPIGQLGLRFHEVPTSGDVILVCQSGNRSGQALSQLWERGFRNVRSMIGGMSAYPGKVRKLS